jgi:glutamate/tyrosine decarboxylase-like PLP-dependent enzyme
VSTRVEERALAMLCELLDLPPPAWPGRTFTTGATAANILGLACAREAVLGRRLEKLGEEGVGVAEMGLLAACGRAGVREIQVLTAMGHSSLYKAASVIGLGRAAVKDIGCGAGQQPWRLDLERLQQELQRERDGVLSIVVLSGGEVNTGRFSTEGVDEVQQIRELCDRYGAWLHVDGGMYLCLFGRHSGSETKPCQLLASLPALSLALPSLRP